LDTIGPRTKSCAYIAEHLEEDFALVDVGCAYGLQDTWRAFGPRLRAVGFDANRAEIDRMAAEETNPKVNYVCGLVGLPDDDPSASRLSAGAYWDRIVSTTLSTARSAATEQGHVYSGLTYLGPQQPWSELGATAPPPARPPSITLGDYLPKHGFSDIDFLKLDVDGPDFLILRSISALLSRPETLGVTVEVNFFGSDNADVHTFHNTDRLMRACGFELFNLSVRRYSSAALPWPYVQNNASLAVMGRPYQGDAFYMKDVASPVRAAELENLSASKLAKAAALLTLHGLFDQAAQVAVCHSSKLSSVMDVSLLLDLLTDEIQGRSGQYQSYEAYMAGFDRRDPSFFGRGGYPYVARRADADGSAAA
jgi:hypothetical protein